MSTHRKERERTGLPPTNEPLHGREAATDLLKQWRQKLGFYSLIAASPAMLAGSSQGAPAGDSIVQGARAPEREAGFLAKRKRGNGPAWRRNAGVEPLPFQYGDRSLSNIVGGDDCPGFTIPTGNYPAASPYVDTGDTTGANNTIDRLDYYYYYSYAYNAFGPDRIYSFTVRDVGTNPKIEVTATSPSYRPMIYLLDAEFHGCPSSTGNAFSGWWDVHDSRWGNDNTATINPSLRIGKTYHLFVDSSVAGEAGTYTLRLQDVSVAPEDRVNFALAANGGVASASSVFSGSFPPSATNNGDRRGLNWGNGGGWNDATRDSFPDWLEINFDGVKSISKVDVFTIQDSYQNPSQPNEFMTYFQYGLAAFDIQYWNGSDWVTIPGGNITNNNKVWRTLSFSFSPIETSGIRIRVNAAQAGYSRIAEVEAWGYALPQSPDRVNVALAENGGVATASSTFNSSFPASGANNGDRLGLNWGAGGGWNDGTANAQPDTLEIAFDGVKAINEVDVFSVQDNYENPARPNETMTFSQYGVTSFDVQYWDGDSWVYIPGAIVIGNNRVWRKLTFSPVQTTKIRVIVNGAMAGYSRIVEVEAWTTTDPLGPPPPPTPRMNFALAANGGSASASSTHSGGFPASGANNGDRTGSGWGSGGGWNDGTASGYPDWLQIDFNGAKMIDEIDVFTLQDNYQNPGEPTDGTTFTQYGITTFDVQYWDGTAWLNVPSGSVTNNNKVWTKLNFSPIQTTRIRILVNGAMASYTRIVEVEAHGT